MNLGEIQDAVDQRTGWDYLDAHKSDRINAVARKLSAMRDWPWLRNTGTFNTVASTGSYGLPANWQRTRSVAANNRNYNEAATEEIDDYAHRDFPDYAYIYSIDNEDELLLRPIPQSVFAVTHRYTRTEKKLTVSTDVLLMPERFHEAVVARVCADEAEHRGDERRRQSYLRDWDEWLVVMRDELRRSAGTKLPIIRHGSPL